MLGLNEFGFPKAANLFGLVQTCAIHMSTETNVIS